jgi:3-hydroxyisobutyrate dehydrogenase-like beta-hydroxyacid dehydrogenase
MAETIGFIGVGNMGIGMAKNLLAAGYVLKAWNRTADKARPLADHGATVVNKPAETAVPGGVVISMLSDDAALASAAGIEVAKAIGRGGVHISMSTVGPPANESLAEIYAANGGTLVAAPVFGRPDAAAAKKLWICTSGPVAAKQRIRPILDAMGQGIFDFGEKVGSANVVKLSGNFLLIAAVEAMSEAGALAEKHGIPRADLLGMLTKTLFNCPIYNTYAKLIADAQFEKVAFKAELALKDMRLAREAAVAGRAPMPALDLLCERYLGAVANGRGGLDMSVLAGEVARDAGLTWGE